MPLSVTLCYTYEALSPSLLFLLLCADLWCYFLFSFTSPHWHLFKLAQIRGKATCYFLSHNLVTATIATHRSQPLCIQMIVTEVCMYVWVCMRKAGASLLVGGNTNVVISVFVCLLACTHAYTYIGETEIWEEWEHKDQLNFYSPFDFSVNALWAEASTWSVHQMALMF